MRESACKQLIFSSTCATYGEPEIVPIPEDHPQKPVNPYGQTKLEVERLIKTQSRDHGLAYAILRYFNAAGADPEGETGELHDPETHLVPLALQAAAGRLPQLKIFGDDYPTPDGTCIRDYIHVTDLVEAHLAALGYLRGGGSGECFNLANGNGFSVREVVTAVEKVTGRPVPVAITDRREGDPPILVGDAGLAHHLLRWKPEYASLERIIETAWKFMSGDAG